QCDVSVHVLDTDLNALGNNILANDTIAIINPNYSSKEAKHISDLLGVEVIRMGIGGFETVGANNILTNKGIVLNNAVSEKEEEELKGIFKSVSQSTANMGALSIGLCAVANSKGVVVGKSTTGYELANISDGLAVD
ncbi:MAG: translation initiation factor 6, partial [Candidatus Marsarchaeota archaeon]|nr:translation initiation factor 6 [Candidatus Marsarchaeota archaeon]